MGATDDAIDACREALRHDQHNKTLLCNLLFALTRSTRPGMAELFDEHRKFAQEIESPHRAK